MRASSSPEVGATSSPGVEVGICREGHNGPRPNPYYIAQAGETIDRVGFNSTDPKAIVKALCNGNPGPIPESKSALGHARTYWENVPTIRETILYEYSKPTKTIPSRYTLTTGKVYPPPGRIDSPSSVIEVDQSIYPMAAKGTEGLVTKQEIKMYGFSKNNEQVLATADPLLVTIIQEAIDSVEAHEREHLRISREFVPGSYLEVINELSEPTPNFNPKLQGLIAWVEQAFMLE